MMNLISEEYLIKNVINKYKAYDFIHKYETWEKIYDLKKTNMGFWRVTLPNGANLIVMDTYYPVLRRRIPFLYSIVKDKTEPFTPLSFEETALYICRLRSEIIEDKKEREAFN